MNIDTNKKVLDLDVYTDYQVILPSGEKIPHWSISRYRIDMHGSLITYAYYANGVGSKGDISGAQREVLEAVYVKGEWAGIRYVAGWAE